MTLYALWLILASSLVIETLVRDWRDWAGAKVLAGMGIGAIQATLPVYVMEWAPVNIRGALIVAYGFWNTIGKFLANLVLMVVHESDPTDYKTPILTQWAFLGIMLPIFIVLPETPAYYANRGQDNQGQKPSRASTVRSTATVRAEFGDEDTDIKSVLRSYIECFHRRNLRRTLGACLPGCAQQLPGLSFLNTYASRFFKQSGLDNAFLITIILCSIQLATSLVLMLLTDKFGRRLMVFGAMVLCTLTLLILGIQGFITATQALKNILVFLACAWSFANTTIGSLGYAFVGEVASQRLRARTAGVASALSVVFGLAFNTSLPIIRISHFFYGLFLFSALSRTILAQQSGRRQWHKLGLQNRLAVLWHWAGRVRAAVPFPAGALAAERGGDR
ncbi:general substrate transporter [Aspergillus crustosus]